MEKENGQNVMLAVVICEFMGTAGDSVVNTISNNFGSQTGQFAQQNLQQFATNPNQFAQTFPNQVSNQLGMTFPGDKFC